MTGQPGERWQPASLADIQREHILATLRSTKWNENQAAGILGIER
jgi:transcriptional regulator of acetoin/glycerol metabolism